MLTQVNSLTKVINILLSFFSTILLYASIIHFLIILYVSKACDCDSILMDLRCYLWGIIEWLIEGLALLLTKRFAGNKRYSYNEADGKRKCKFDQNTELWLMKLSIVAVFTRTCLLRDPVFCVSDTHTGCIYCYTW